MSKRRSFPVEFKARALRLFDENKNVTTTARDLGVERNNLYTWIKQREKIVNAVRDKNIDTRKSRKLRKGKALFPELDAALVAYIQDRKLNKLSTTSKMVQRKTFELFPTLYPESERAFIGSRGFLRRFLNRNGLVFRRVTSVGQKIPPNAPELCD